MTWDSAFEATPGGGAQRRDGDDRIRELKTEIRTKADVESTWGSGGNSRHREGSARVFVDTTAPTVIGATDTASPATDALDQGRVWVDPDNGNRIKVYENALPPGSPEWRDVSTVDSANAFFNGEMRWWQYQGTSITGDATHLQESVRSYGPDGFFVDPVASAGGTQYLKSFNRVTNPVSIARARYAAEITGNTSIDTVDFGQRVTGEMARQLGETCVFHFKIQNDTGAALTPKFVVKVPQTTEDTWSATTVVAAATNMNDVLTGTTASIADGAEAWVYAVLNVSGYANYTRGLQVTVQIPATFLDADTKKVTITEMCLQRGNWARPYPVRPAAEELQLCQTRLFKTYDPDALPGGSPVFAGARTDVCSAGSGFVTHVGFPITMRAAPTVTVYSTVTGTAGKIWSSQGSGVGLGADLTAVTTMGLVFGGSNNTIGQSSVSVANSTVPSQASYVSFHLVADAEFRD